MKKFLLFIMFLFYAEVFFAQHNLIDYSKVTEYTLVDVYVHGCQLVDSSVVRLISGLPKGEK